MRTDPHTQANETEPTLSAKNAIISVVLAAMFFLSLVAFYNVYDDWEKQKHEDINRVLAAAEECATQQQSRITSTEILLRAISASHFAQDVASPGFYNYLRTIDGIYPGYLRFNVVGTDGRELHRAQTGRASVDEHDKNTQRQKMVRNRDSFKNLITKKSFVVGEYLDHSYYPQLGQNAVLPLGMPVFDEGRHLTAVLTAILDMSSGNATFQSIFEKNGIETVFFDRKYKLLYRYPPREGAVYGTPAVDERLLAAMASKEGKSYFITIDPRGRESLYALVKLRQSDDEPYMFVLSISRRPYFMEFFTSQYLAQGLGTIVAILLSIWLASRAGRRFFSLGLETLAVRVNAIKSGDLSSRLGRVSGCREIKILGEGMNAMLDSLEESNEKLKKLSNTDALTGLCNRRHFYAQAGLELRRASRNGQPVAIAMADLDHFKSVNDTYGHDGGDAVLRSFSSILKEHARATDIVARLGGEEFILMMPGTDAEGALTAMEKIRRITFESSVPFDGKTISYTMSAGLYVINPRKSGEDAFAEILDNAVKKADMALYRSKESGRNRVSRVED